MQVLERIAFLDLREDVLARARRAVSRRRSNSRRAALATLHFLVERRIRAALLSFDDRMLAAARAIDLPIAEL